LRALQKKMETAHANLEKARSDIANFTTQRGVLSGQLVVAEATEAAEKAAAQQEREAAKAAAQQKREAAKATRKREREEEAAERKRSKQEAAAAAKAQREALKAAKAAARAAERDAKREAAAAARNAKARNVETVRKYILAFGELATQVKLLSDRIKRTTDPKDPLPTDEIIDLIRDEAADIAADVGALNGDSDQITAIFGLAKDDKTTVAAALWTRFANACNGLDEKLQAPTMIHGVMAELAHQHDIEIPALSVDLVFPANLIRDKAEAKKKAAAEAALPSWTVTAELPTTADPMDGTETDHEDTETEGAHTLAGLANMVC
jgi:hypothetical protein